MRNLLSRTLCGVRQKQSWCVRNSHHQQAVARSTYCCVLNEEAYVRVAAISESCAAVAAQPTASAAKQGNTSLPSAAGSQIERGFLQAGRRVH